MIETLNCKSVINENFDIPEFKAIQEFANYVENSMPSRAH